ncbi:MAG: tetratricopeptide repeat protein [Myxococcota bacterium]
MAPLTPLEPAEAGERKSTIELAWFAPAASLDKRLSRTRRAALSAGVWNLDPAARAVLTGGFSGDALERTQVAVGLAPDLPAARMERARALWLHADSPVAALAVAISALRAIPRHLEASLWFGGAALYVLAVALVLGGLLCIAASAVFAAPHAAHDLGDAVPGSLAGFARFALLSTWLLVPLALGEGALGLAVALLAPAMVYGSRGQRVALAVATATVLLGAYPVAGLAGSVLTTLPGDPVADAALFTAHGAPRPHDRVRLEAAAEDDALAARALALQARQAGSLAEADSRYRALLELAPDQPGARNNAANVHFEQGRFDTAVDLYERANERGASAVALFNLAQAYGKDFQVDRLSEALERAQALDSELLTELAALQVDHPEGFVIDAPLPRRLVWQRVLASGGGEAVAAEFRASFAPGRLGADPSVALFAFAAVALAAALVGWRLQPSRWCPRCGRRVCPRCHGAGGEHGLCAGCTLLFLRPESADRSLRVARINALRVREERLNKVAWLASVAVPGAAGLLAGRPVRCLLGALFFALALAAISWRGGVVPDPLVAGAAAPVFFLVVASVAGAGYAAVVALSIATRRSR